MKAKKLTAIFMAAAMTISMTACGSTETPAATEAPATDSTGTDTAAETTAADGETTLTMWTIATESDAFHEPYLKAIADYEEAHPGVKIKMDTFENESYKTKIKSAVAANELPDIFFTWAGGFSADFIATGEVLPLSDYYDAYKDQISEAALANATYDGTLYGSVTNTPVSLMFYNKKIFDANGLKVPETLDELKDVCGKLKAAGVTPIATSVKDTWVFNMLGDGLTLKSAGPDATAKAITRQGVTYGGEDFLPAAQALVDLRDAGAFIDGATGLSNDEACQEFYQGNAAIYFTGSWMSGSIATDAPTPEDFDCAPIPVINPANAKLTDFMGGGSDTLMVSAATENKDLAAQAAFEITRDVSKYSFTSGAGIPAWKVDYDADVSPMTQKIADYCTNASSFTLWFDTLMTSEDAGVYLDLMQQLYVGDITPEEFDDAMNTQLGN
ncbi:MAG: extracellular solute-binding protein [Lachnospiraceae bacterium]|nr:extracellular solute-binding protein [Lachnospiraceae bacterium]